MKKSILSIAIFAITLLATTETAAQKFKALDKSPMDVAVSQVVTRFQTKL